MIFLTHDLLQIWFFTLFHTHLWKRKINFCTYFTHSFINRQVLFSFSWFIHFHVHCFSFFQTIHLIFHILFKWWYCSLITDAFFIFQDVHKFFFFNVITYETDDHMWNVCDFGCIVSTCIYLPLNEMTYRVCGSASDIAEEFVVCLIYSSLNCFINALCITVT